MPANLGEISAEACAWVAQIESGELSPADLSALREWTARSPLHAQELREVAAISGDLSVLTELIEPLAKVTSQDNPMRRAVRPQAAPAVALALTFTLVIGALIVFSGGIFSTDEISPTSYRTAVGEYRTIALEDGTAVKLNTDSLMEIDFTADARRVRLVRGEAYFEVASLPDRPFQVYSGEAVAEAVGTAFVMRLRGDVAELSVVEGVVAFAQRDAIRAGAVQLQLDAGEVDPTKERVVATRAGVLLNAGETLNSQKLRALENEPQQVARPTISARELQRKLSWTEGLFDFSETPLEEVVAEVNRHNTFQIEIADPRLRELRFGGIFRTGDVEALLGALEGVGIEIVRRDDGHFQLRQARQSTD